MSHKKLLKQALIFFTPVMILLVVLELALIQIPFSYTYKSDYFNTNAKNILLASFGSSQMQNAINPDFLDIPAINFGSTSQHHRLDFEILKQTKDRLPNLKTVVFELSTNHLQLQHNGKDFWKNNVYLKYFRVNAFDRNTYFKDYLIYISRPDHYSGILLDHYFTKKDTSVYNSFGYKTNEIGGVFAKLKYDETSIRNKTNVKIGTKTNPALSTYNLTYFEKMLQYCLDNNIEVIIATIPMHTTFFKNRDQELTRKRDSTLISIAKKYNHVTIYSKEEDTISYITKDFLNANHLNARGGEKFSKELNTFLKTL